MSGATGLILEQDCTWVDFLLTRKKKRGIWVLHLAFLALGQDLCFRNRQRRRWDLGDGYVDVEYPINLTN